MGYGDYVIGNSVISRVYYVEGLRHNLFSVRSNLYTILIEDMMKSSPIPASNFLKPGQISSGLVPNSVPATPYAPPTNKELEILFQPMFDEYLEPPRTERPDSPAQAEPAPVNSVGTPLSTTIDQDAPTLSIPASSLALLSHSLHQGVAAKPNYIEDRTNAPIDNPPFVNVFAPEPHSEASSSGDISSTESPYVKDKQENDNIGSKPDKNGKRGEAEKSQKQLQ
nr:hypothetical protein [Tanacetum cinerariifolium]